VYARVELMRVKACGEFLDWLSGCGVKESEMCGEDVIDGGASMVSSA
jgi:hypothetical protein